MTFEELLDIAEVAREKKRSLLIGDVQNDLIAFDPQVLINLMEEIRAHREYCE